MPEQFDLFVENDPSDEGVDDVLATASDLRNSVLYHTDWTVETLIGQLKKGRIELNPEFQRRDAWGISAKSLLIESIILNFPVPAITLAEQSDSKKFIVVDGKQRLTALAQFFNEMPSSKNNGFRIRGLTQLKDLNGLSYGDLCANHPDIAGQIENYSVRTNVIRGWKNDDILFSIFHRLNSGSVKLSTQELRQSLHPGEFTSFITSYSEKSPALRDMFPGAEPDFRMRDVELVTRYISLSLFIQEYRGDLKRHLDSTVETLNKNWGSFQTKIEDALKVFESSYAICIKAFSRQHAFRKWNGESWETRSNRAIFDTVMYNLTSSDVQVFFINNATEAEEIFQEISLNDDFRNAIEQTTKTSFALFTRINLFGDGLRARGVNAPILDYSREKNKISVK